MHPATLSPILPPMGIRREPRFILFDEGIDFFSWRGAKWFILTYFGAFLVAAILAPFIYAWIQSMQASDPDSVIAYLQSKPISRYVDRVRLLFAAGTLIWLIGACRLWGRFGFMWSRKGGKSLFGYLFLGVISLAVVVALQSFLLELQPKREADFAKVAEIVLAALAGGLLIGWIEEAIFRGMVLRMFYTAVKPGKAILLSALVFAAVHFKSVPDSLDNSYHWYSSFIVAGYQSISVFLNVEWIDFANLFLVGIVLNLVFLRTGSLVGCMGLHAGWVLVRNTWSKLVDIPESAATQFWGTESIVDGYASLIILAAISIALYVELRRHQKKGKVALGDLP